MSPLLWNAAVERIISFFSASYQLPTVYADDVTVVISASDAGELEARIKDTINSAKAAAVEQGLEIADHKTQIMLYRKSYKHFWRSLNLHQVSQQQWYLNSHPPGLSEVTDNERYLNSAPLEPGEVTYSTQHPLKEVISNSIKVLGFTLDPWCT